MIFSQTSKKNNLLCLNNPPYILVLQKSLYLLLFISFLSCSEAITGRVDYVSDGDTFHLLKKDGSKAKIRVADIDCPERLQPYGLEAKEFVINEIKNRNVTIYILDVDRYGRLVARVYYDKKDLSEELIKKGLAWHYKEYSDDLYLASLEKIAREAKVGLWASAKPEAPWDFRKKRRAKKKQVQPVL